MWEIKVGLILLAAEVMDVSCNTLNKLAMAKGLSNYIFTTYTHGIAFVFLIPLAYLFHRKTPPPPISFSMILRLFLLGVLCCGCSIFLNIGVRYSSPTLASATNNLSPALTFILGIIFRMEILNIRSHSSLLKSVGTLVSIAGAFVVTLYQGMPIILFPPSPTQTSLNSFLGESESQPNWALGGLFLLCSCVFLSLSYVAKTWIARDFHSEILITLISFFFETIVAALVTLYAERDNTSVWTPRHGIEIIALLFGALEVGVVNFVQTWACGKKGPLFVAMFKPLQMIIAVILGVSFLGDILHLGSVIGGTIIAIGFYTVMKGKIEEESMKESNERLLTYSSEEDLSPHKVPLLYDKNVIV